MPLLTVLVVVLIVAAWSWNSSRTANTVTPQPSDAIPTPNRDTATHAGPKNDTAPTPQASATPEPNPDHPVSATLAKPIGPNNSSGTASRSSDLDSTCQSVTGASCYIQATMDGHVVIVSDTKTITADSQGVDLPWSVSKLTVGDWSIRAVATKNGQKALSSEQILKVTP